MVKNERKLEGNYYDTQFQIKKEECENQGKEYVSGYKREDGTWVKGFCREKIWEDTHQNSFIPLEQSSEIEELIKKYGIKLQPDGRLLLSAISKKNMSKIEQEKLVALISPLKPEIVKYLTAEKENEKRRVAEKHLTEQIERDKERKAFINNEKSISPDWDDGEYFQGFVVYGEEARLLKEIGMAEKIGYRTIVPDDVIRALGKNFTYTQAVEYMKPINEQKQIIKQKQENDISEKYARAKTTGSKVLLSQHSRMCQDRTEECSLDMVYVWAMPDGTTKKEIVHTY